MSIGPVESAAPEPEPQSPESKVRATPNPSSTSGSGSSGEASAVKSTPAVPAVPEDEVHVHWDTPMADYIMIYQFVNQQSGSLILQEPDQAILSLIHQIRTMLENTAQQAAAVASGPVRIVE
jgi:hypothetical protein